LQGTPLGSVSPLATPWERLKLGTAFILSGD
jgi:hypothetical protein